MSTPFPRRARALFRAVAAALLATACSLPAALAQAPVRQAQPPLPQTRLAAGIHVINAEVAATEDTRRMGLMYRTELPGNAGMLFVFEAPDVQCFWMRNTLLPLSIAFIADDGTIVNIEDMAPQTDDPHCARKPVRYALEMSQGWFAEHGVRVDSRIDGLP